MLNSIAIVKNTNVETKDGFTSFECAYKIAPPTEAEHEQFVKQMCDLVDVYKNAEVTDFGFADRLSIREWMEKQVGKSVLLVKHFVGSFYDPTHGLHSVCATLTGTEGYVHMATFSQRELDGAILCTQYIYGQAKQVATVAHQTAVLDESLEVVFKPLLKFDAEAA